MRSVRSILRLAMAAAAASAGLTAGAAAAEHEGGWQDISRLDIIVNIAQQTGVEIVDARAAIVDERILYQEARILDVGAEGFLRVEKWLNTAFTLDGEDPAMGGKSMRDRALFVLDAVTSDASVELVKKLNIPGGVGHAAYVRGDELRCMVGETAYGLDLGDSRSRSYDTRVTITYGHL